MTLVCAHDRTDADTQAFVKADKVRDRTPSAAAEPCQSDKVKSTEWMLTEEAIQNGIESTTRYRPKERPKSRHPTKRAGAPATSSKTTSDPKMPLNRAASGRRGGFSSSRTKAAAAERKRIRQQQERTSQLHLFMKAQIHYQGAAQQQHQHPHQHQPLQPRPGQPFDHGYHAMASLPAGSQAAAHGTLAMSSHHHHHHQYPVSPTSPVNHAAAASNAASCLDYYDGAGAAAYQRDEQAVRGRGLEPSFRLEDVNPYMHGQQQGASPVASSPGVKLESGGGNALADGMYGSEGWGGSAY